MFESSEKNHMWFWVAELWKFNKKCLEFNENPDENPKHEESFRQAFQGFFLKINGHLLAQDANLFDSSAISFTLCIPIEISYER